MLFLSSLTGELDFYYRITSFDQFGGTCPDQECFHIPSHFVGFWTCEGGCQASWWNPQLVEMKIKNAWFEMFDLKPLHFDWERLLNQGSLHMLSTWFPHQAMYCAAALHQSFVFSQELKSQRAEDPKGLQQLTKQNRCWPVFFLSKVCTFLIEAEKTKPHFIPRFLTLDWRARYPRQTWMNKPSPPSAICFSQIMARFPAHNAKVLCFLFVQSR